MTREPDYGYGDVVHISSDKPLRLSADAMRALRKATGRTMSDLFNDDEDEANRIQVMASRNYIGAALALATLRTRRRYGTWRACGRG